MSGATPWPSCPRSRYPGSWWRWRRAGGSPTSWCGAGYGRSRTSWTRAASPSSRSASPTSTPWRASAGARRGTAVWAPWPGRRSRRRPSRPVRLQAGVQESVPARGHGRGDHELRSVRPGDDHLGGVQIQSGAAELLDPSVEVPVPVAVVAGDGMARVLEMHADLMLASGEQPDGHDGGATGHAPVRADPRLGALPGGVDDDPGLRATQRCVQDRRPRGPAPCDDGQIVSLDLVPAVAEQLVEVAQHRGGLGQGEHAGGIAVETVAEFQFREVGPQLTERFDHPRRDVRALVDRD